LIIPWPFAILVGPKQFSTGPNAGYEVFVPGRQGIRFKRP
jgi:hypothetical protein